MRLAAYSGVSTALAAGVIIHAFNQRANFYSACVYLSQSNLCLMILTNLILFITASFMFGLQRLFYGPLRPIEIEQLYEKAWFAVTETCLAMTIFRDEVGAWFLVMFVALLAGKVWGWIGEGRVEVLEQQPPANPRLVHTRLSLSLILSLIYDMWILGYTINAVIQQARPNMMVMFLFEFAVLTTSSYSTSLRYVISLVEAHVTKKQTQERLEWRRREVREEREEILRQRTAAAASSETDGTNEPMGDLPVLPSEDDVDEMDIEVPGWEAKGQWVLSLDLITDFIKLAIYTTFFFILLTFYGLPIHIMRDLFLTARSFIKRLTAFLRYRKATHDMNERYPDASIEEIQREDTCIICREEMRPWSVTNPPDPPTDGAAQQPVTRPRPAPIVNERSRPKKLPCGHVLHLGCLKSWLERQQACPTCRRPVVDNARSRPGQNHPPGQGAQAPGAGRGQAAGAGALPNAPAQPPNGNVRMINIGPLRFAFGQANNMQEFAQRFPGAQAGQQNAPPGGGPRVYGLELGFPRLQPQPQGTAAPANGAANSIATQLHALEQQIMQDLLQLRLNQNELQIVQQLQAQLVRSRSLRQTNTTEQPTGAPQMPQTGTTVIPMPFTNSTIMPRVQQLSAAPGISAIPSGSSDLPPGVTIPEGWSLLPLQRLERVTTPVNSMLSQVVAPHSASGTGATPTATTSQNPIHIPSVSTIINADRPEAITPDTSSIVLDNTPPIVEESPTLLPNWGASQLFGPSNNSVSSSNDAMPSSSHSDIPPALSEKEPSTNGTIPHSEENGEPSRHKAKGKARAATVEDTAEES